MTIGNLTRIIVIRSEIVCRGTEAVLVQMLKNSDLEIVYAVTGVLVNLSADVQCKGALLDQGLKLLHTMFWTLRRVGLQYIELTVLMVQVWAFTINYKPFHEFPAC